MGGAHLRHDIRPLNPQPLTSHTRLGRSRLPQRTHLERQVLTAKPFKKQHSKTMTFWDGNSCPHCDEQSCYVDNGVDESTPCRHCGWFRGTFDGSRYPPGYCATSWRYATERIRKLREEFPDIDKQIISQHVQAAGEDDMEAETASASLIAYTKRQE